MDETQYTESGKKDNETAIQKLDRLIGIEAVKEEVKMLQIKKEYNEKVGRNVEATFDLHYIIIGNSGTGKTTAARLLGEIMHELGYLGSGHTVKVTRMDLIAGYVGQTAIKTREKIEQAIGGVLFVDEAYSLAEDDFGQEAINEIIAAMTAKRGQFSLVLAGYPEQMNILMNSNPGFKRYFKTIYIEDYTSEELLKILHNFAEDFVFTPEYIQKSRQIFDFWIENKERNFGNAREVRKYLDECETALYKRISAEYNDESDILEKVKKTLTGQDIPLKYSSIVGV